MINDVTKVGEVSNFVTDDGKDLDERYLGINAKAKSAETADSVDGTSVSSVVTVAEATQLAIESTGGGSHTYTVPERGILSLTVTGKANGEGTQKMTVYRNSEQIYSKTEHGTSLGFTVNKIEVAGTVYKATYSNSSWASSTFKVSFKGTLLPLALTGVSNNE